MTDLVLLNADEIQAASYDSFNAIDLKGFQTMQDADEPRFTVPMGLMVFYWESALYQSASNLSDSYNGGFWKTENGFFELQTDESFVLENGWGSTYEVTATEFSMIANLYALSHLAMATYESKPAINRRAVFFSDYIKQLMDKNRGILNTNAIYLMID
ncbi:antirestriction protein [Acinetobacter radioresistens]|jgi:hypothetical protein|uniref:Antirestriction protein n=3 Tax=Acinetobacter TaxID=469 RepID=A0AAW6UZ16_9GAMM|nr:MULTISPECIES: hypothetical protein [Acinetobacter]HAZ8114355.1 antirestriction protein [Escherichia coli]EET83849.1 antirestriction protein [Acinetobacter radioresistens SK82]EHU3217637.1 hypothetical protein [Acinetobacter baumannii]EHU3218487.1 hypothetical protein [Acinetobacter baumannii]EJO33884.1 hypothetical protein ACINWCA157_A0008 [Acinetobacter radioresistens WC-A-157]